MSEVRFYHLLRQSVERALPALLGKALETGKRIVVKTSDARRAEFLNDALWTQDAQSFLPHGSAKDGHAADQPVWITDQDDVPNGAQIMICVDGADVAAPADFDLCCHVFDGNSDQAVQEARAKWKALSDQGIDMTYWQQTDQGWQKKA
ncbi:MAG: DNA polymerase III subunit chi [Alphaproteobacteria bacterium]|nr:DNA polymerase III subunit chi [Alphaproteobacteria bacterium]HCQ70697.1 DNA polymerase III subunit chi [Rhodospirillaceae bacterium]|tara:strand:+ start:25527 stop:25973 length:447 start_codon:yes stop_codon:yes gene_type:complete